LTRYEILIIIFFSEAARAAQQEAGLTSLNVIHALEQDYHIPLMNDE
jgi:hypothetical protein